MTLDEVIEGIERRYESFGGEMEPDDMRELREAIYAGVKNARGLQVLFGTTDHGACMAVFALKQKYDYLHDEHGKRHTVH